MYPDGKPDLCVYTIMISSNPSLAFSGFLFGLKVGTSDYLPLSTCCMAGARGHRRCLEDDGVTAG